MNYYYLRASLPGISIDTDPTLTYKEYRATASQHLSPGDMKALVSLENIEDAPGDHPFVKRWKNREISLRNALAKARASALQKDAEKHVKQTEAFDSNSERVAAEALAKNNPLDKELTLDKYRWAVLEEIAGFDHFSSDSVLAYGVQLRISERWSRMDTESGTQVADKIVSSKNEDDDDKTISENNDKTAS